MDPNEISIEEQLKKYPRLKMLSSQYLFVTLCEMKDNENSGYLDIIQNKEKRSVSLIILNKILNDDIYFNYTKKVFLNPSMKFKMACILNGNISRQVVLGNRLNILNMINIAINKNLILLNDISINRYKELYSLVSFSLFKEKNKEKIFEFELDKNTFSIPVNLFFEVLDYDDETYEKFFNNLDIEFHNFPKHYFIYGLIEFFNKNNVLNNYLVSDKIKNRIEKIERFEQADIEFLYQNKDDNNKYLGLDSIKINDDFRKKVFDGMNNDFTLIEKAIYIYIKMCILLSYDEEYFALDQEGEVNLKHQNIKNLENIAIDNNEIVCFEFNMIYSKFLSELGIDYKINGNDFGKGHQSLCFYCDKYIVNADSVTSILDGDLVNAKINEKIEGLQCINKNNNTKNEFKYLVCKIYKIISEEEKKRKHQVYHYNDLLNIYRQLNQEESDFSLENRMRILINKVNSLKESSVDVMGYISKLKYVLFSKYELQNNFQYSILRKNFSFLEEKSASICAVFTLNLDNIYNDADNNIYFIYYPYKGLNLISKEDLKQLFLDGHLSYMKKSPKIPGIEVGKKQKK